MASILRLQRSSVSPEIAQPPAAPFPVDTPPSIAHLFEQLPGKPCCYRWHDETAHYCVLGEGPPLLLVHSPGVGIRSAVWRLQKPTMLIWGRHATSPPLDEAEVFCELNPLTQFVIFERSSIAPHEEEPKRFNETALRFLHLDFAPGYAA